MTTSTHTRIASASLVLGALFFTVADLLRRLVAPDDPASATALTQAVGEHGATWLTAGLLAVAAAFCFVPAMVAFIGAARGRGARTTVAGAALVGVGAVASVGHAVAFYSPYALFHRAGTPGPAIEGIEAASENYPLLVVLMVLFMLGMVLGPVVLLVGLRRARRVPVWSVIAAVVFVASGTVGGPGAGALGIVAALAAFTPAARALANGEAARGHHHASANAVLGTP